MKIEIKPYYHDLVRKYEKLLKDAWYEDFLQDFGGQEIISDVYDIYIAYENEQVLGGAIISEDTLINKYSDPFKTEKKKDLIKEGYKSLTYLFIDEKYRGQGIAKKLIKHTKNKENKIWLTCIPNLASFYINQGFVLHHIPGSSNNTLLLTYNSKKNIYS